jgi:hypothetical protein
MVEGKHSSPGSPGGVLRVCGAQCDRGGDGHPRQVMGVSRGAVTRGAEVNHFRWGLWL